MRKIQLSVILVVLAAIPMLPPASLAQQPSNVNEQPKVGIGVKVSTLGAGVEVAVPLLRKLNVRGGFNAISYSHNFHQDGILYAGNLSWRSGEASVDWYPFGGPFHLSPGLLAYNGNKITANASVPGGQDFTLSGVTYMSGVSDPILGTGKLDFTKVAPTFRLGFGNLVPRSGRHWSIMGEVGVVYEGTPRTTLAFTGTACAPDGSACVNAATDPTIQTNVQAEQSKINKDLSILKFYPILSLGVGFNF